MTHRHEELPKEEQLDLNFKKESEKIQIEAPDECGECGNAFDAPEGCKACAHRKETAA